MPNVVSNVKVFLSSWKNLTAIFTLILLGAWIYSRVWMINPAILGDEFLYSMNARKVGFWEPPIAGDFSNYLYNFVFQITNLCGTAFYSCTKLLNIFFFLGFVVTLFILAQRFLPYWVSYMFMVVAALSPLSIYTSMFLPESMYFFAIGLVLVSVLRAMSENSWRSWALVGITLGAASLVKPHAWLTAIGIGVTFLVLEFTQRPFSWKASAKRGIALAIGSIASRVILGVAIAGPQALGFFGQYLGFRTLELVVNGGSGAQSETGYSSPMDGVIALFAPQLTSHSLAVAALMGSSLLAILAGLTKLVKTGHSDPTQKLALFTFIWLLSLVIAVVMFTGWVTAGGDDHSSRALMRYYDFMFLIVPLAGFAAFWQGVGDSLGTLGRWVLSGILLLLISPAFTGSFANLTIQIADAPFLAGLVVNVDVFNAVALLSFIFLLVFATFHRYAKWVMLLVFPVTMLGTGWQIQDQYQNFRATYSVADQIGKRLNREYSDEVLAKTWVLGESRFDVTNVAFWADNERLRYDPAIPGTEVNPLLAPAGTSLIVTIGEVYLGEPAVVIDSGEGYAMYKLGD